MAWQDSAAKAAAVQAEAQRGIASGYPFSSAVQWSSGVPWATSGLLKPAALAQTSPVRVTAVRLTTVEASQAPGGEGGGEGGAAGAGEGGASIWNSDQALCEAVPAPGAQQRQPAGRAHGRR